MGLRITLSYKKGKYVNAIQVFYAKSRRASNSYYISNSRTYIVD